MIIELTISFLFLTNYGYPQEYHRLANLIVEIAITESILFNGVNSKTLQDISVDHAKHYEKLLLGLHAKLRTTSTEIDNNVLDFICYFSSIV